MKGRVVVRLRQEVLDPQGATVANALENLGYRSVEAVRQGKIFDIELDTDDTDEARDELERMARELLANPVIEEFQVSLEEDEWGRALTIADRRSGVDRRSLDRRTGNDRRASEPPGHVDDRRSGEDRRGDERRSADRRVVERRSGDERRQQDRRSGDDSDYAGRERRQGLRRLRIRRREDREGTS